MEALSALAIMSWIFDCFLYHKQLLKLRTPNDPNFFFYYSETFTYTYT